MSREVGPKAETLGEPFEIGGEWAYAENHPDVVPGDEPGLIYRQNGHRELGFRKHQIYRPYGADLEGTYRSDYVICGTAVYHGDGAPMGATRDQGNEIEVSVLDGAGQPTSLYHSGGSSILAGKISHPPELWNNTLELNGLHADTPHGAVRNKLVAVKEASEALAELGLAIDPASARMQDVPGLADVTPNPYVETVVDIWGNDKSRFNAGNILKFYGNGGHAHFDMAVENLPVTTRYVRTLAPLLNVGLLAAPFAVGEVTPELGEVYEADDLRASDGRQPQSVRYVARAYASPSGGVGERVVHDTLDDALRHADREVRDGMVTNPSRQYGSHSDVRPRYDAPNLHRLDHPGRLEVCVYDTGALRQDTLNAYSELTQAVLYQLEKVAIGGEQAVEELHRDFPKLFGEKYGDAGEYGENQLERTHRNSVEIGYDGADALIEDGMGNLTSAREQVEELMRFAQRGHHALPAGTVAGVRTSLAPMKVVESAAAGYTDASNLPSLNGYYKTGIGNPAQWMILRAQAAQEAGVKDVMRDNSNDRVRSLGRYLSTIAA